MVATRERAVLLVGACGPRVDRARACAAGVAAFDPGDIVDGAPAVARATIRAVRGNHGARLLCGGAIDEGRAQRLRNVFGIYPIARLQAAAPIRQPTLGQWLGIAWLAWLLDRSRDA